MPPPDHRPASGSGVEAEDVETVGDRLGPPADATSDWLPPVDIVDTPTAFEITVEVCGVPRDDINIHLDGGRLTVWGVRHPGGEAELHHYRERRLGRFARSFSFRTPVDQRGIAARLADGVLTLTLPKQQPKRIPLE